jgi:hypothetical protein
MSSVAVVLVELRRVDVGNSNKQKRLLRHKPQILWLLRGTLRRTPAVQGTPRE